MLKDHTLGSSAITAWQLGRLLSDRWVGGMYSKGVSDERMIHVLARESSHAAQNVMECKMHTYFWNFSPDIFGPWVTVNTESVKSETSARDANHSLDSFYQCHPHSNCMGEQPLLLLC